MAIITPHAGLKSIAQAVIDEAFATDEVLRNFTIVDDSPMKEPGVYGEYMATCDDADSEAAKACVRQLAMRAIDRMRSLCEPFADVGGRLVLTRNPHNEDGAPGIYAGFSIIDGKTQIHMGWSGGVSQNVAESALA